MNSITKRYFYSVLVGVLIISIGWARGHFYGLSRFNFQADRKNLTTNLLFKESHEEMGLNLVLAPPWPNPQIPDLLNKVLRIAPSIAVFDFNRDGYQDLLFTTGKPENAGLALFLNKGGIKFEDVSAKYFGHMPTGQVSTLAGIADFNNDGYDDIIVGRYGKQSLYYWNDESGRFEDHSDRLSWYYSNPWSLAILDYNKDGLLDIAFGNYYPPIDLSRLLPPWFVFWGRGDNKLGAENHILEQSESGFSISKAFQFPHKAHTASIGVSDINGDGYPDLFEGNDYAADHLYLNKNGKTYEDISPAIPIAEHGFAGMNAEFFDFDFDGIQELYVTNISAYPSAGFGNVLWKRDGSKLAFTNVARSLEINSCGFSWSAKFADFDMDGSNELYVTNGNYTSKQDKPIDFWYRKTLVDSTPPWLRSRLNPTKALNITYSGEEADCLFQMQGDQFKDVAYPAGVANTGDGRAVALVDLNNDGLPDIVNIDLAQPVKVYMNMSQPKMEWIGVQFRNRAGSAFPVGAKFKAQVGHRKIYREIYLLNGFHAQSDARVVFAVAPHEEVTDAQIEWPNGNVQSIPNLRRNTYNLVEEKISRASR